jgi:uncharacterized membrane protein
MINVIVKQMENVLRAARANHLASLIPKFIEENADSRIAMNVLCGE